jgi:hypothetical protein
MTAPARVRTPTPIVAATVIAWVCTVFGALGLAAVALPNTSVPPMTLLVNAAFTAAALIAAVGATRQWRVARVAGTIAGALMLLDGLYIVVTWASIPFGLGGGAVLLGLVVLAAGAALAGLLVVPQSSRAWFGR